jgi:hypothetical protein
MDGQFTKADGCMMDGAGDGRQIIFILVVIFIVAAVAYSILLVRRLEDIDD